MGNPEPPKRGKISGWSKSSRRRMREFLVSHAEIEGLKPYGVSLTIPGPSLEPKEARKLWNHFSKNFLTRNGCGAVWRVEVQRRGAAHWHLLFVGPEKIAGKNIEECIRGWWFDCIDRLPVWFVHAQGEYRVGHEGPPPITPGCVRHEPAECYDAELGPDCKFRKWFDVSREPFSDPETITKEQRFWWDRNPEFYEYIQKNSVLWGHTILSPLNAGLFEIHGGRYVQKPGILLAKEFDLTATLEQAKLLNWPGARERAVDVQGDGDQGAWKRYLIDHATKVKQEQIAVGFGRHWGVVGKGKFKEVQPYGTKLFSSERSHAWFVNWYNRLACPQVGHLKRREATGDKFSKRPFQGRSLGFRTKRGKYGKAVSFSLEETIQRLYEAAENLYTERMKEGAKDGTERTVCGVSSLLQDFDDGGMGCGERFFGANHPLPEHSLRCERTGFADSQDDGGGRPDCGEFWRGDRSKRRCQGTLAFDG